MDAAACIGCGACVAACPSGAMRYAFPSVTDLLGHIRLLLKSYRAAGGTHPRVLFHDGEAGEALLQAFGATMPESVIPVQIEEIGATANAAGPRLDKLVTGVLARLDEY